MSDGDTPPSIDTGTRPAESRVVRVLSGLNRRLYPRHLFFGPQWLVLGVNNVCNLHCKMCDVGQEARETNFARNLLGSRPMDMPLELMRRIVEQARESFPRVRLGFAFTEPLLYRHLAESVAMAADAGLRPAVTTNGLTLRTQAAELARAGLTDIYLSIDGPAEVHDHIRGREGSFRRAMAGIEALLKENPRPAISVFCVITPWNVGRLAEFVETLARLPLDRLGFMHANFTPENVVAEHNAIYGDRYPATISNLAPFDPGDMDLGSLLAELEEIDRTEWPFPVDVVPRLTTLAELERFYLRPGEFIGTSCGDAFRTLMIKTDGSVIPAHGRCYNLAVGNLHRQPLRDIWNSPTLGRFRVTLNRAGGLLPACSRCCSAF